MTDDRRLGEIRMQHTPITKFGGQTICRECGENWPCDIAYLLERLERVSQDAVSAAEELVKVETDLSATRTRLEEVEKLIVTATTRASVGAEFIGMLREALGVLRGEPVVKDKTGGE